MTAALLTPVFTGMTPIFGKLAMRGGLDPFTLSALRTCLAALVLWIVFFLFFRRYTFIFPAGLLGTAAVGSVNGLGSLFYYNGLLLLDNASLAQILFMTYVVFAMLLTHAEGRRISAVSVVRGVLALVAVWMLASGAGQSGRVHWMGVSLCLIGAALYALHVIISQRVMFEMPAPTMALYGLSFMGLTVLAARLVAGSVSPLAWTPSAPVSWWYVMALMGVTALSRVTLFTGVRSLGGLQTVLLNVAEMGVTLLVAFVWLDERMTLVQWGGVALLVVSALLSRWDPGTGVPVDDGPPRRAMPRGVFGRWLSVRNGLGQITR
jgi:DME family drug/metabolite transporter